MCWSEQIFQFVSRMEAFDSVRRYMAGFRAPDVSKLWGRGQDDATDGPLPNEPSLIIKLEYYLVRCQELALWQDPKASMVALTAIHLAFGYLATTSNTVVNLTLWVLLAGFVYTTWTQRIWPEIRVPDDQEEQVGQSWVPVSPDVYSAPELMELMDKVKATSIHLYTKAVEMRAEKPGAFCACSSAAFLALWYLGTLVTTLGLLYYLTVAAFIVPGITKVLLSQSPEFVQFLRQLFDSQQDTVDSRVISQPDKVSEKEEDSQEAASSIGHQVSDMMASMCSSLTTGVATLTAQLPEMPNMSQLEQKKQELLINSSKADLSDTESMEESMSPYLPDQEDLASHQILETCTRDATMATIEDPTQPDSFQSDETLEEDDLLPSCPTIPAHDEPDQQYIAAAAAAAGSIGATAAATSSSRSLLEEEEDDNREFLPTAGSGAVNDNLSDWANCQTDLSKKPQKPVEMSEDDDDSLIRDSFGKQLKREVAQMVDGSPTPAAQDSGRRYGSDWIPNDPLTLEFDSSDDDFVVLSASEARDWINRP